MHCFYNCSGFNCVYYRLLKFYDADDYNQTLYASKFIKNGLCKRYPQTKPADWVSKKMCLPAPDKNGTEGDCAHTVVAVVSKILREDNPNAMITGKDITRAVKDVRSQYNDRQRVKIIYNKSGQMI